MATLALFAVGSAIGTALGGSSGAIIGGLTAGAIGGAVGASVGGLIDSQFIFPAVFGSGNQSFAGPRLDDFRVQLASEGSPMNFCMGPENRLAGVVIWSSDLIEVAKKKSAGGKGGGSSSVTNYAYKVSCAVGVCEGEITEITKIWADTKVIYGSPDPITVEGISEFTVTKQGSVMRIYSPIGGPDLTQFKSNVNVTITGFANAANNGTFKVKNTQRGSGGYTTLRVINAAAVVEASGPPYVFITQTVPIEAGQYAESITVYNGTTTQTADATIQSYEGAANTPAFRGLAYVVFENLKLADFGNRMPQFTFLVKKDEGTSVQTAIGQLIERAGLTSGDYDVTRVDECLTGYAIAGPMPMGDAITPLLNAYSIRVQESQGKLKFFHYGSEPSYAVSTDKLGAGSPEAETTKITVTDRTEFDLPSEVNVQYFDVDRDHQKGSQRERRNNELTKVVTSIDVPMALTATQARNIAIRTLWTAWAERQTVELTLPPQYVALRENEMLEFTLDGYDYAVRVATVDRGNNYLVRVRGVIQEDQSFEEVAITPSNGYVNPLAPGAYIPPFLELVVFDAAPLRTEDAVQSGVYYAVIMANETSVFTGASLFQLKQGSSTYREVASLDTESTTMGLAITTLGTGSVGYWDRNATVDVELYDGELTSASEADVLNGVNAARLGSEIIGFQTATLIDTRTYRLSGLLRGLRNTAAYVGTHAANENFLLLDDAVKFLPIDYSFRNTERRYKAVPVGATVDDVDDYQGVILYMSTFKPWAPCHVVGARSSGDLIINWKRRTRGFVRQYSGMEAPLLSTEEEAYDVVIRDGGNDVRTIVVSGATTTTYTSAQQTTDFGSPQASIVVRIYQVTPEFGRSDYIEVTL